jgi:hypothetical protein
LSPSRFLNRFATKKHKNHKIEEVEFLSFLWLFVAYLI